MPERFGGYVLVADVAGEGRSFAAALARSITPDTGRVQFPTYALDATWPQFMNENVLALFEKLGVKAMRLPASYAPESAPEYPALQRNLDLYMGWAKRHDVSVMLTLDNGSMRRSLLDVRAPGSLRKGRCLSRNRTRPGYRSTIQTFRTGWSAWPRATAGQTVT